MMMMMMIIIIVIIITIIIIMIMEIKQIDEPPLASSVFLFLTQSA